MQLSDVAGSRDARAPRRATTEVNQSLRHARSERLVWWEDDRGVLRRWLRW